MALIVEDGTGMSDAESYLSVADISAVLARTGEDAAWLALASDTVREQVARKAMRALENERTFRGEKKTQGQALEWPRDDAEDDDGYLYANTEIPAKLKEALALLCAAAAVPGTDLQPTVTQPGRVQQKSIRVGKIAIATAYEGSQSQVTFHRKVESLLSELVEGADQMVRA